MLDKLIFVDGHFVSQRVSQVVQAIQEYNPELEVQWIPHGARAENQAAFRIIHNPPGREPYVIFHVDKEEDFDARVLKRIMMGDQQVNGGNLISEIEATEAAARAVARQRFLDEIEEASEMAQAVFKSNKSTYKVNDDLVIKDYRFGNHAPEKPRYLK